MIIFSVNNPDSYFLKYVMFYSMNKMKENSEKRSIIIPRSPGSQELSLCYRTLRRAANIHIGEDDTSEIFFNFTHNKFLPLHFESLN